MALDMAKYRSLFLEEAGEYLGEMSRALLELEKSPGDVESIDVIFRMAHSIKSMAASLGYDPISELSHRLEDRMEQSRMAARVEPSELGLLFKGLEGLERMVAVVRETGEGPAAQPDLLDALGAPGSPGPQGASGCPGEADDATQRAAEREEPQRRPKV